MLITAPDIVIFDALKIGLKYIKTNWNDNTDKTKTWLYKVLEGVSIQKIDYLEQAQSIFLTNGGDPRFLDINIMYNQKQVKPPSVHITLGTDNIASQNALGMDQGGIGEFFEENEYQNVFTRRFSATYNIVITSDNSNEVIIIYHVLRALMIGMYFHLNEKGFQNLKYAGGDLNINQSLMPKGYYSRVLSLIFEYPTSAPEPIPVFFPTDFEFEGKPVLDE